MRKAILSMMLAAVAMCAWAANDGKTLKVKLDIVDFGDSVTVYRSGEEDLTFVGKDGKFEFEMQVDKVCHATFVQPRLFRGDMEDPRVYSIPVVGGESVRIWDTTKERYDVDGTGFYADYHKIDLFVEKEGQEQLENATKYRAMRADNTISNEERHKFYQEVYSPSFERYQQALIDYIKAHPKQEAAITLLNRISDFEKMKETFLLFDPTVREGRMKPLYDRLVKEHEQLLKEEAEAKEAAKKQAAGIEAPVFTLNDINGKPLALTSLRGKYVILDFWGSWCVWCIKGFPKMKEYYAKYPGKFEILGIDCNDTEEKWKAAVKKHDLPWLHVYNPKDSKLLEDYGVTGFPTKIVIAPDGKIFKTIVGEDPSFYTLLDELFK
jgi:thiol-disulfide isomerase/thioredoxin